MANIEPRIHDLFWSSYEKITKDFLCVEFNKEQLLFEKFFSIVDIFSKFLGKTDFRFGCPFSTLQYYHLTLCVEIHFSK